MLFTPLNKNTPKLHQGIHHHLNPIHTHDHHQHTWGHYTKQNTLDNHTTETPYNMEYTHSSYVCIIFMHAEKQYCKTHMKFALGICLCFLFY